MVHSVQNTIFLRYQVDPEEENAFDFDTLSKPAFQRLPSDRIRRGWRNYS